jgi:hypothetical protein
LQGDIIEGFALAQQKQQQQQKKEKRKFYGDIRTVIEEALKNSFHNKRWNETSTTRDRKISLSVSPSLPRESSRARQQSWCSTPLSATQRSGHPCAQPEVDDW